MGGGVAGEHAENEYVYSPNKAETQADTHTHKQTHTNTQNKNNKMH